MESKGVNPITKKHAKTCAVQAAEKMFSCRVLKIRCIGGGSFGYVYLAKMDRSPEKIILKACRTQGMCEREAMELTLLGKNCPIKIPKVYFTLPASEEIPIDFICMEYIEGKNCFTNPAFLLKSRKAKQAFADKVTSAMRIWHETENDTFGPLENAVSDTWLAYYKPFAEDILVTARKLHENGKPGTYILNTMERAWRVFDEIFSEPVQKAGLIHGDLNVMNIMADKDLHPVAFIDPLESKWADTEYDLFQLRNLTGERFGLYQTYKAKYPVSQKCDLKVSFYALFHEVYCYILSGRTTYAIMLTLARRMNRELKRNGLFP